MDIRNSIRIDTFATTGGLDQTSVALNKLAASYDKVALSQGLLARQRAAQTINLAQLAPAEQINQAVSQISRSVSVGLGNAFRAIRTQVTQLAGQARIGFTMVAQDAEGAARRTADAFSRLRVALPRIGLESTVAAFRSGFQTMVGVAQAGVGRIASLLRGLEVATRPNLALVPFGTTAELTGLDRIQNQLWASTLRTGNALQDLYRVASDPAPFGRFGAAVSAATRFISNIGIASTAAAIDIQNFGLTAAASQGAFNALRASASAAFSVLSRTIQSGGAALGRFTLLAAEAGRVLASGLAGGARAAATAVGALGTALGAVGGVLGGVAAGFAGLLRTLSTVVAVIDTVSVSIGARFEQSMNRVFALTNVSAGQFQKLSAQVVELSTQVPFTAKELGDGLYYVVSAGIKAADAFDVLAVAAKAATAGQTTVEVTANAITSAMLAYSSAANKAAGNVLSAAKASDIITRAVVEGKTEFDTFADSIGRVLPLGAQLNISFAQLAAALATVTRLGLSSDEAATALRGILRTLAAPTKQSADALSQFGLNAAQLRAELVQKGLLATLQDLYARTHGNIDALEEIIPNIRALTGFLALANSQADAYKEVLNSVEHATDGAGATTIAFDRAMDTFINHIKILRNDLQALGILIFNALEKPLNGIIDRVSATVLAFIKFSVAHQAVFTAVTRVTTAIAALSFAIFALPKLLGQANLFLGIFGAFGIGSVRARQGFERLASVLHALLPVFALVGAAAYGFVRAFDIRLDTRWVDRLRFQVNGLVTFLGGAFRSGGQILRTSLTNIFAVLNTPFSDRSGLFLTLERTFAGLNTRFGSQLNSLGTELRARLGAIGDSVSQIFGHLVDRISVPLGNIVAVIAHYGGIWARQFVDSLGRAAVGLVEGGARLVDGLVRGLIQALPRLAAGLNQIKTGVLNWILQAVPAIAAQFRDWIDAFLRWAYRVLPMLIYALTRVLAGMLDWIIKQTPVIASTLLQWAGAFANWVLTDALPGLLSALGRMIDGFVAALMDTKIVQRITATLVEWTAAFVEWAISMIPVLIGALANVIGQLVAFLVTEGPRLAAALIGGFIQGLEEGFDKLQGPAKVVATIITFLLVPALVRLAAQALLSAAALGANLVAALIQTSAAIGKFLLSVAVGAVAGLVNFIKLIRLLAVTVAAEGLVAGLRALGTAIAETIAAAAGPGAVAGLLAIGPILLAVGAGVGLFAAAYITNFLGIRDITNSVVGFVIEKLTELGNAVPVAAAHVQTSSEQINIQFRKLVDSAGLAADVADKFGFNFGALVLRIQRFFSGAGSAADDFGKQLFALGATYNQTADQAQQFVVDLLSQNPWLTLNDALLQYGLHLHGLPNILDDAVARAALDFTRLREASRASLTLPEIGIGTIPKPSEADVTAWNTYKNAVDSARNAVVNFTSPLEQDLADLQKQLGQKFTLQLPDIGGLTRDQRLAAYRAFFKSLPQIPKDADAATVAAVNKMRADIQGEIDALDFHLDTIALESGLNLPDVIAVFEKLKTKLGASGALKALQETIARGVFPGQPDLTDPAATFATTVITAAQQAVAAAVAKAAGAPTALGQGILNIQALGHNLLQGVQDTFDAGTIDIKIPNTAFKMPTAAELVGTSGTEIGNLIATQLGNTSGEAHNAALAVAGAIAGILAIHSEPADPSSPLRGITYWGLNMVETIAAGMTAGAELLSAATITLSNIIVRGLTGGSFVGGLVLLAAGVRVVAAFADGLNTGRGLAIAAAVAVHNAALRAFGGGLIGNLAALAAGINASSAYAQGLGSNTVRARARSAVIAIRNAVNRAFSGGILGNLIVFSFGVATGQAYADGLAVGMQRAVNVVYNYLGKVKYLLAASSPPGPGSPLHEIDDWGFRTMLAYADGIQRGTSAVTLAARRAVGGAAGVLGSSLGGPSFGLSVASGATAGALPVGAASFAPNLSPITVHNDTSALLAETRTTNALLSRLVARDPKAAGPLSSRGTLAEVQALTRSH